MCVGVLVCVCGSVSGCVLVCVCVCWCLGVLVSVCVSGVGRGGWYESGFGMKVVWEGRRGAVWMKVVLDESGHGMKVVLDESGLG